MPSNNGQHKRRSGTQTTPVNVCLNVSRDGASSTNTRGRTAPGTPQARPSPQAAAPPRAGCRPGPCRHRRRKTPNTRGSPHGTRLWLGNAEIKAWKSCFRTLSLMSFLYRSAQINVLQPHSPQTCRRESWCELCPFLQGIPAFWGAACCTRSNPTANKQEHVLAWKEQHWGQILNSMSLHAATICTRSIKTGDE